MQHVIRIRELERRAKVVNLSLRSLCCQAGVTYSTVRRWERGATSPRVDTLDRAMAALEKALASQHQTIIHAISSMSVPA